MPHRDTRSSSSLTPLMTSLSTLSSTHHPPLSKPCSSQGSSGPCSSPKERDEARTLHRQHSPNAMKCSIYSDDNDADQTLYYGSEDDSTKCVTSGGCSQLPDILRKSPIIRKACKPEKVYPAFPSTSHIDINFHMKMRGTSSNSESQSDETDTPYFTIQHSKETPFETYNHSSTHHASELSPVVSTTCNLKAYLHSHKFPRHHSLNPHFVSNYKLRDELGSGGYGFVMTARHRTEGHEVAVKFIIKDKVPEYAWTEDEAFGKLPTEVVLLCFIQHKNIVKCLDLYEDSLYFYLVQELHGSPWQKPEKISLRQSETENSLNAKTGTSIPALSPSLSLHSLDIPGPTTPPQMLIALDEVVAKETSGIPSSDSLLVDIARPEITRRPSHDLFECIEQSEHKRLLEDQARYVFRQVVEAVLYLDSLGVTHRDIKDENLVIDKNLKVKLIDFGSAIVIDPQEPQPFYNLFYGTAAYASSEILLKKSYQAPPAEIWTLGVLLSYLLTGASPFPSARHAADGRIHLSEAAASTLSAAVLDLMRKCLDPNPSTRATIRQVRDHPWLLDSKDIRDVTI